MFIATKNNKSVFADLIFIDQVKWTGGKARSVQLKEIFINNGFEITTTGMPAHPGKISIILWAIKALFHFGYYRPFGIASLRTSGTNYFKLDKYILQHPNVDTFIFEGTGYGDLQKVQILKHYGKKVILIPANVESLAQYENAWTHQIDIISRLKTEARYYKMADAIFCISLEEVWLLGILGANAYFLPYYPPSEVLKRIDSRKELRKYSMKNGSFYFADFGNPPSYLGFKKFINDVNNGSVVLQGPLKVAGFNTHLIMPLIAGTIDITILGELPEDELEQTLINCNNVIINHYPTSGMLTRVPELLLSGIPVKGNTAALKAYSLISGISLEGGLHEQLESIYKEGTCQLLKTMLSLA